MNHILIIEKDSKWKLLDLESPEGMKAFADLTNVQIDQLVSIQSDTKGTANITFPKRGPWPEPNRIPTLYNNIPLNPNLVIDGKLVGAAVDVLNENKHLGLKWGVQLNLGRWEGIANDPKKNRYEYRSDWELVAIARMYIKGEY